MISSIIFLQFIFISSSHSDPIIFFIPCSHAEFIEFLHIYSLITDRQFLILCNIKVTFFTFLYSFTLLYADVFISFHKYDSFKFASFMFIRKEKIEFSFRRILSVINSPSTLGHLYLSSIQRCNYVMKLLDGAYRLILDSNCKGRLVQKQICHLTNHINTSSKSCKWNEL